MRFIVALLLILQVVPAPTKADSFNLFIYFIFVFLSLWAPARSFAHLDRFCFCLAEWILGVLLSFGGDEQE